jgi:hypothetical protein
VKGFSPITSPGRALRSSFTVIKNGSARVSSSTPNFSSITGIRKNNFVQGVGEDRPCLFYPFLGILLAFGFPRAGMGGALCLIDVFLFDIFGSVEEKASSSDPGVGAFFLSGVFFGTFFAGTGAVSSSSSSDSGSGVGFGFDFGLLLDAVGGCGAGLVLLVL